jgi:ABC-type sugar transport system substrate-binding protein
MKRAMMFTLLLVFIVSFAFTAGVAEDQDDRLSFAVIPMFVGHPWFERCEWGAQKAADDLGIKLTYLGPEKADAARQLDIFQDQVNKGVDAILVAVSEAEMWKVPIENAIAQGIPVFGFDIGGPGTIWLASGWETVQSGINIAEGIVKDINKKGKVAILTGSLGSPFLAQRQRAAESVFNKYPDIEIVGVFPTEDDYEKALRATETVLQAHPDLAGFACMTTTCVPASARASENACV